MKYLLLTLISYNAFAQTGLNCPPESMAIEYMSPVTKGKVAFCGYQKDGQTIKHGKEESYNQKGELTKTTFYQHGKETKEAPAAAALPGTEETTNSNSKGAIQQLMSVLVLKKGVQNGQFKVSACDNQPKAWVMAAMMQKNLPRSYAYKNNCDVTGAFVASFKDTFPVNFTLRNLEDFENVDMKVKMDLNKSQKGILYKFEVQDGVLRNRTKKVKFLADYEIEIDMLSGDPFPDTQKGKITITEEGGKPVNETSSLQFDY